MMYPTDVGRTPRRTQRDPNTKQWMQRNTFSHDLSGEEGDGLNVGKEQGLDGDQLPEVAPDPELVRKRKELQEIEEQIILKKAAIALKKVEPFLRTPHLTFTQEENDFSHSKGDLSGKSNEFLTQLTRDKGAILSLIKKPASFDVRPDQKGTDLRDRVNLILQQRWPLGHPSKVTLKSFLNDVSLTLMVLKSLVQSSTGANTLKEWSKQEDHPLKLRVESLMRKRCGNSWAPQVNGEVPDTESYPSSKCPTSALEEENAVAKGFHRFLGVLNKGVDINLLTKIVNDDNIPVPSGGEPPHAQPPFLKNALQAPYRRESQGSHSGIPQLACSVSKSNEASAEHLSHWGSHKGKHSDPDKLYFQRESDEDGNFGSRSRSRSPLAVEKKEVKIEEQQGQVRLKEQQGHLQNILETLGLSLDTDELSRLTKRTQERLYGKKKDDRQRDDDSQEKERCQTNPQRIHGQISSSTAVSGSVIPNMAPVQRSLSNVSEDSREKKLISEMSHSRERVGEDGNGNRHVDGINLKENSQNPYPENTTCFYPQLAVESVYPQYSSAQYSSYAPYQSEAFNGANPSAWQHPTHTITPSQSKYPYSQYPLYQFPSSTASPELTYHCPQPKDNLSLRHSLLNVNTNLAKNNGKNKKMTKSRFLKIINTQKSKTKPSHLIQLTKSKKSSKGKPKPHHMRFKKSKRQWRKEKRARKKAIASANQSMGPSSLSSQGVPVASKVARPKTQESEGDKLLTEEDIRANLKKRLEDFNQKMKHNVT